MPSPLEKARQDPDSMKARILASARRLFGEYGYSSTTTRMIAGDVGIDISTLYYHWGEKLDLYEALITDLNDEILAKFEEVEQQARGKTLSERLGISRTPLRQAMDRLESEGLLERMPSGGCRVASSAATGRNAPDDVRGRSNPAA